MRYILISACLLGIGCRYDGKEKGNADVIRLLQRDDICLIPVCPEQAGGLPTPRIPSERKEEKVINSEGVEVTLQYMLGAKYALRLCELYGCKEAILKEKSPSCGAGRIYDGSFSRTLISGDGVTSELLKKHGIKIYGESDVAQFFDGRKDNE